MPRQYRKVTPHEIAQHIATTAIVGNGSQAVREMYPTMLDPGKRSFRIVKKSQEASTVDYIEDTLQQIGIDAVNRVGLLVNSTDEKVAGKNSQYVIDHLRGKPLQRSESKNVTLNIESVL